ncbi:unnamed protein product [Owenia fusiformis]|uniref:Fucosyltransferase n=2 Tax=Owenia fusiformis TaxID=6347 RepID=A0A8S4PR51_OWEFU|nr:unnamed protein product [Owenia fusiformis]
MPNKHLSNEYMLGCPQKNCRFVAESDALLSKLGAKFISPVDKFKLNLKLLQRANAVVFHALSREFKIGAIPPIRPYWQKWLFTTVEAPRYDFHKHAKYAKWNHLINLTVTVRSDASKQLRYGYYKMLENEKIFKLPSYSNRTLPIAWVASHCTTESRREQFVRKLKEHIPVDSYGRCGTITCPENCFDHIENNYKFYLALENSDCPDYITEKSWKNSFSRNLIPIVRGSLNGYARYLPPGSFIHTDSFPSIKHLADYLWKVFNNQTLYESYFKWKDRYEVVTRNIYSDACTICTLLHDTWDVKQSWEIDGWWSPHQCKNNHTDFLS